MTRIEFFTGTDTDVGKTYCAVQSIKTYRREGLRVGVYKPVASGCGCNVTGELISDDAVALWDAAGRPLSLHDVCPQRFAAPLSPHRAAEQEGLKVDDAGLRNGAAVWLKGGYDVVVIEGAGGLFSPLSEDSLNIDFIRQFPTAKVILIAADRLGVIHQVVSTCRAAEASGHRVDEIRLNAIPGRTDSSTATNHEDLSRQIPQAQLTRTADVPSAFPATFPATSTPDARDPTKD